MRLRLLFLVLLLTLGFTGEAHAYIDPGSGLVLLQLCAASIIGALLVWKNALIDLIKKLLKKPPPDQHDEKEK